MSSTKIGSQSVIDHGTVGLHVITGLCHEAAENCALLGYYAGSTHCIITPKRTVLIMDNRLKNLTLNLPTTTIVAQPFNVIKLQLKFNPVA
jgi:hypothetical protein